MANKLPPFDPAVERTSPGWALDALPDIEIAFNDDGTATVIERLDEGCMEYRNNLCRYTLSKELTEKIAALFYDNGPIDLERGAASDYEEWHEERVPPTGG